ncbi:TetR/AcrR family transcriptional regulator [Amorphus sp. 3PC139-8]|uniref:TetR/AcrR family transcriptional regulator n=1 Tax=Amorphus sp. 3PC139-8 TaxID=2735676 RepID=UPI00345D030E
MELVEKRAGRQLGSGDAAEEKPMRADARRNRDRLVAVAAEAFAANGVQTSLEDIAREAGVGIGTLYRHFPTREHLVEAVYRREVDLLCQAAEDLAKRLPPDDALEDWLRHLVSYAATKRGMMDSLRILLDTGSTIFADTPSRISQALQGLVEAASKAGTIRQDVEAADILQATSGLYSAPETPDWKDRALRLVSVIMDGLRHGAPRRTDGDGASANTGS